jgi:L-asparagine transporter-like permease
MSRTRIFTICAFLLVGYLIVIGLIISAGHTPLATKANRACQSHQGTAPNGIHAVYFICRDGYVAER